MLYGIVEETVSSTKFLCHERVEYQRLVPAYIPLFSSLLGSHLRDERIQDEEKICFDFPWTVTLLSAMHFFIVKKKYVYIYK